jgi:hypothetical protein
MVSRNQTKQKQHEADAISDAAAEVADKAADAE